MNSVTVRGAQALYFDAGQPAKEGQPNIVFVHGSGCDHSIWAMQSRYFAFHGWNLFAVNLPGHGVGKKVSDGPALESVEDMAAWIIEFLDAVGLTEWKIDFGIARGLGYYTGPVFETLLHELPSIGSVMSGGRYDGLVGGFVKNNLPAVGASIGLDRLFAALAPLSPSDAAATAFRSQRDLPGP